MIAHIDADGNERLFEGVCEGTLITEPRGSGGFGYDPAFVPVDTGPADERTMAELEPAEKHAISHRGRAARALAEALWPPGRRGGVIQTKSGAAGLSIASNATLIVLKLVAGAITGSISIITEAIHSAIDLLASIVAFFSVRAADEPADREHPYGHEKLENLAAAIEGMLILVGAGIIIFEATRRLVDRLRDRRPRRRDRGDRLLRRRQPLRLGLPLPAGEGARVAGARGRRGSPAHRRDDLGRRARSACSWSRSPARPRSTRSPRSRVAGAIVVAGVRILTRSGRVLVDESPPASELDAVEAAIAAAARTRSRDRRLPQAPRPRRRRPPLHRPAPAVPRRDQRSSTRTRSPTHVREAIEAEIPHSEVLIHTEPEESFRPPEQAAKGPFRAG